MIFRRSIQCHYAQGKKSWFLKHVNDQHVKKAQAQGFRSRASFKLLQIQEKFSILKRSSSVLDLGCAPGSWCQAIQSIDSNIKIVGVDLLPMKQLQGVDFYHCDARNISFQRILKEKYGKFDAIVSDMAPNFSGTLFQTHEETIQLNKTCLELSLSSGSHNCSLVMKTVEGQMQKSLVWLLQFFFSEVSRFKPKSSRSSSVQHYLICRKLIKNDSEFNIKQNLQKIDLAKIGKKNDIETFLRGQKA